MGQSAYIIIIIIIIIPVLFCLENITHLSHLVWTEEILVSPRKWMVNTLVLVVCMS